MSETADNVKPSVKLAILEAVVNGHHWCSFGFGLSVGESLLFDRNRVKETNDSRKRFAFLPDKIEVIAYIYVYFIDRLA